MKVKDLMTKKPAYATPDTNLSKVAKLMESHNVGMIPIVDKNDTLKVIGVITDRDIAVRCVAQQKNPLEMRAEEIMSQPVMTVNEEDNVTDAAKMMERRQIRHVPVIDQQGKICGMVAQADIALKSSDQTTADVVQAISKPAGK